MTKVLGHPIVRWIAVIILLLAYLLVSQGFIGGQSIVFNLINSVGSVLLIANSLSIKPRDWAVAVFNMVWLLVALITILGILL